MIVSQSSTPILGIRAAPAGQAVVRDAFAAPTIWTFHPEGLRVGHV